MKISVIITTHNRCALLRGAIESVCQQTYPCHQIIVVDDFSSDETEEFVSKLDIENLVYYRSSENKGACHGRNIGIGLATGDYISGLDDDDIWLPNRLELLVKNYSSVYSFVCASDLIVRKNWARLNRRPDIITLDQLLLSNCVGNQILVKRDSLLGVGGFDEALPSAQDYDTWLRLVKKYGPAKGVDVPLQLVREAHGFNRISTSSKRFKGFWMVYKRNKSLMSRSCKAKSLSALYFVRNKNINMRVALILTNGNVAKALLLKIRASHFGAMRLVGDIYGRYIYTLWGKRINLEVIK